MKGGMTTARRAAAFSAGESKFIKSVLAGMTIDKALKGAGLTKTALRRGVVMDEILSQYARLSLRWSGIVGKAKKCLSEILDDPDEKGATKVQACKLVFWAVLNSSPALLRETVEIDTRDGNAEAVLGSEPVGFGSDQIQ